MNDIMSLKHNIKEQNVSDSFKIFIYEDNTFAVNQYIETIAEIKNVDIRYITSLSDLNTDDIFDDLKIAQFACDEVKKYFVLDKALVTTLY